MQATFVIKEVQLPKVMLFDNSTGQNHQVCVQEISEGQGEFVNLPNKLQAYVFNFTPKDIFEDTLDVLNVLITMYDAKGDGQANLMKKMPTEETFAENLEEHC